MRKILFVCNRNRFRSPTAETIFSDSGHCEVLSAGLTHDAETPLTPELVAWAETIFVMEKAHKIKLQKRFGKALNRQRVICLDIPDNYAYMQPELIQLFKDKLGSFFERT